MAARVCVLTGNQQCYVALNAQNRSSAGKPCQPPGCRGDAAGVAGEALKARGTSVEPPDQQEWKSLAGGNAVDPS